jgi:hypothetical protein
MHDAAAITGESMDEISAKIAVMERIRRMVRSEYIPDF